VNFSDGVELINTFSLACACICLHKEFGDLP